MGEKYETFSPPGANIKVIGIGGGGGNAINTMIRSKVEGVEFIAANTDVQALQFSLADKKIQLGRELTRGLGAGANPDIGRDAALEDKQALQEALAGANMVFVTCGMGGGTGTGGASIIAQIAKDIGALVVGVVTKPFNFEGKRRRVHADTGINRLREQVDTLITIPNQKLLQIVESDLSMIDSFKMADTVLVNAVKGISDIINVPGLVNVDFADVKTIMSDMGLALMGIGTNEGEERAIEAANQAVSSPLLEDIDIEGATGILVNITAGEDITLREVDQICNVVQEAAHEDCNIIFGAVIDPDLLEQIKVTVIATGFPDEETDYKNNTSNFNKFDSSKKQKQKRKDEPINLANIHSNFSDLSSLSSPFDSPEKLPNLEPLDTSTEDHFIEKEDLSEIKRKVEGASKEEQENHNITINDTNNPSLDKKQDSNENEKVALEEDPNNEDIDLPAFVRNGLKNLSLS